MWLPPPYQYQTPHFIWFNCGIFFIALISSGVLEMRLIMKLLAPTKFGLWPLNIILRRIIIRLLFDSRCIYLDVGLSTCLFHATGRPNETGFSTWNVEDTLWYISNPNAITTYTYLTTTILHHGSLKGCSLAKLRKHLNFWR